jgi:hypothetical protein
METRILDKEIAIFHTTKKNQASSPDLEKDAEGELP